MILLWIILGLALLLVIGFITYLLIKFIIYKPEVDRKNVIPSKLVRVNSINDDLYEKNEMIVPIISNFNNKNPIISTMKKMFHILVLGGSGSGKTLRVIEPMIIFNSNKKKNAPSMIIVDVKSTEGISGSLYMRNKNHLEVKGYKIVSLTINPKLYPNVKNMNNEINVPTDFFNPLSIIWEQKENKLLLDNAISDFADFVVPHSKASNKDSFWDDSTRMMIAAFIHRMIEHPNMNKKLFNPKTLVDWLTIDFENVLNEIKNGENGRAKQLYSLFIKNNSKDKNDNAFSDIKKTIATKIDFLIDNMIQIVTSDNNFDVSKMRTDKIALFIRTDDNKKYMKFTSLVLDQINNSLAHHPEGKDVIFFKDEFASLSYIPNYQQKLEKNRSLKIWEVISLQSLDRFVEKYGTAGTLIENVGIQIILSALDDNTIKAIVGGYQDKFMNTSHSSTNKGYSSSSESERVEEFVMPRKIKNLKDDQAIIRVRGYDPFETAIDYLPNLDSWKDELYKISNKETLKNKYIPQKAMVLSNGEDEEITKEKMSEIHKGVMTAFKKLFTYGYKRVEINETLNKYNPSELNYWNVVSKFFSEAVDFWNGIENNNSLDTSKKKKEYERLLDQVNKKLLAITPDKYKDLFRDGLNNL